MAGESNTTTDHDVIRHWIEDRGGKPATVKGTSSDGPGILRVDFPGYGDEDSLEELSWDDFFDKFDKEQLAFLYQEDTANGSESRFFKFIQR